MSKISPTSAALALSLLMTGAASANEQRPTPSDASLSDYYCTLVDAESGVNGYRIYEISGMATHERVIAFSVQGAYSGQDTFSSPPIKDMGVSKAGTTRVFIAEDGRSDFSIANELADAFTAQAQHAYMELTANITGRAHISVDGGEAQDADYRGDCTMTVKSGGQTLNHVSMNMGGGWRWGDGEIHHGRQVIDLGIR